MTKDFNKILQNEANTKFKFFVLQSWKARRVLIIH